MINLKGFIPMDSKKRNFNFGKRSLFEKQYRMDKRLSRIEKWDYFPKTFKEWYTSSIIIQLGSEIHSNKQLNWLCENSGYILGILKEDSNFENLFKKYGVKAGDRLAIIEITYKDIAGEGLHEYRAFDLDTNCEGLVDYNEFYFYK